MRWPSPSRRHKVSTRTHFHPGGSVQGHRRLSAVGAAVHYNNPQVDELFRRARTESDKTRRAVQFHEFAWQKVTRGLLDRAIGREARIRVRSYILWRKRPRQRNDIAFRGAKELRIASVAV